MSSVVLRRSRRRLANPSRRRGRRCRVFSPPDVAFCGSRRSGSCILQRWRGTRWSRTPLDGVLGCTLGGPGDTRRSWTPRGGRSGTPAACAERPSWKGTWRRRTPFQAGDGSGAMRVMRWSPDGRSWQNSTGSSAEHAPSRVAGSTVSPQRPGWRNSDRSWRMGLRSQPLWGMAVGRRLS